MAKPSRWTEEEIEAHFKTHRISLLVSPEYNIALRAACIQQGTPSISEIHQQALLFFKNYQRLSATSSFLVVDRVNKTRVDFIPQSFAEPKKALADSEEKAVGITLNLYDKFNKILESISNPKNRPTSPSAMLRMSFGHYAAYLGVVKNPKQEVFAKNRATERVSTPNFLRF